MDSRKRLFASPYDLFSFPVDLEPFVLKAPEDIVRKVLSFIIRELKRVELDLLERPRDYRSFRDLQRRLHGIQLSLKLRENLLSGNELGSTFFILQAAAFDLLHE